MRRFRTTAALLALLATLPWSLTVVPCEATPPSEGTHAEHGQGSPHSGHDHGQSRAANHAGSHGAGHEPDTHPTGDKGQACGALMACGAGLRGMAVAMAHPVVPPRPEIALRVGQGEPSSADLTQDPPPPRPNA
jgi:hypothetical protein